MEAETDPLPGDQAVHLQTPVVYASVETPATVFIAALARHHAWLEVQRRIERTISNVSESIDLE